MDVASSPRLSTDASNINFNGFGNSQFFSTATVSNISASSTISAGSFVAPTSVGSESPLQHQQQPALSSTGSARWHDSARDIGIRKHILKTIVQMLFQRRPSQEPSWRDKLLKIAKKLESKLYFQAQSLSEYQDEETIRSRLQSLASHVLQYRRRETNSLASPSIIDSRSSSESANSVSSSGDGTSSRSALQSRVIVRRFVLHRICPAA